MQLFIIQYQQWLTYNYKDHKMLTRYFQKLRPTTFKQLSIGKLNGLQSRQLIDRMAYNFSIQTKTEARFRQIRMHTTMSQYPGLNTEVREHKKNQVQVFDDKQTGLRFLVESGGFAGCSDLGICIKLGTQDETQKTAGSLEYLKSFVHMKPTFEQIVDNYQILNQTGSTFDLHYDALTTYAKCSFLEEDQNLMADLLLDLILQEKKMFQDNHVTAIQNTDINQMVRRAAFGERGLGMPGKGVGNTLTNKNFLEFQQKITPKNMIISMSNISNPTDFITSIKQKIAKRYPKFLQRKPQPSPKSIYKGGLHIYNTENEFFEFALVFPSVQSKSEHMELFNILRVLLGSSSSFSSGGPGKGMHSRCTRNLMNGVQCVEKASYINQHFENTGLFGLTVGGPHSQSHKVVECTLVQIGKLAQLIPQQQLDRAKHILISSIYQNIERQSDRLEQLSKHIFYYEKIKLYEFEHAIRKVTSRQIQDVMKNLLNLTPTFVYSGNKESLSKLPGEKNLKEGLKQAIELAKKK